MRFLRALALSGLTLAARATSVKQVAGAYSLKSSSDGAGCPATFTFPEPVSVPSTPVSALLHRDMSTPDGACAGGDESYTALLPAAEYSARARVPPDRTDALVDGLLRTDALFGTEHGGDRVCGGFVLRKGALVAFVNSRDDTDFLGEDSDLKVGRTLALFAEANVDSPKRCLYVSDDEKDEDNGGGGCFPAAATVELECGTHVRMDALRVNDRVRVAPGATAAAFSPVFMFTHRDASYAGEFLQVSTARGATLRLTAGHFVHTAAGMVRAAALRPGDSLLRADGRPDAVVRVRAVRDAGLYNPQTLHGDVFVDGVRASTYTDAVAPPLAHAALAPARALFALFGVSLDALDKGAPAFVDLVPAPRAVVY